jgi:hypothetical protein
MSWTLDAIGTVRRSLGPRPGCSLGPGGIAYWTANARDAESRLTQETAGNGVVTTQSFDVETGRLTAILAGTGNIVQNFSYTYDVLGNAGRRQHEPQRDLHLRQPQPRTFSNDEPERRPGEDLQP